MGQNDALRRLMGPDGNPVGPIALPGSVEEVLIAKANAMREVLEEHPADVISQLLRLMNEVNVFLEPMIADYVTVLRSWDSSWEEIGEALGVSGATAWVKYRYVDGALPRGVVDAPGSRARKERGEALQG